MASRGTVAAACWFEAWHLQIFASFPLPLFFIQNSSPPFLPHPPPPPASSATRFFSPTTTLRVLKHRLHHHSNSKTGTNVTVTTANRIPSWLTPTATAVGMQALEVAEGTTTTPTGTTMTMEDADMELVITLPMGKVTVIAARAASVESIYFYSPLHPICGHQLTHLQSQQQLLEHERILGRWIWQHKWIRRRPRW